MTVSPAGPPVATERAHVIEANGDRRVDPFYWLRERHDPEVIDYLEAEHAFTAAVTAWSKALEARTYPDIV